MPDLFQLSIQMIVLLSVSDLKERLVEIAQTRLNFYFNWFFPEEKAKQSIH
ncbi:hypothetical protein [Algoriphagus marinus]|uniref:hypothetical protein n=1 Tax=Algoriphagus marinus TaxID=1925762 RepID=UPI0015880A49|nr:hypothetical protein [Algoriphagus marinus]